MFFNPKTGRRSYTDILNVQEAKKAKPDKDESSIEIHQGNIEVGKFAQSSGQQQPERTMRAAGDVMFNPMTGKRIYNSSLSLREGILSKLEENKLSPAESAKRKAEKQKYKVVYMQDGKKIEVFAATIRGVRRAAHGKSQFRVYDSKGSDLTAYFKKLMNENK